jgi:hypothetical protein
VGESGISIPHFLHVLNTDEESKYRTLGGGESGHLDRLVLLMF